MESCTCRSHLTTKNLAILQSHNTENTTKEPMIAKPMGEYLLLCLSFYLRKCTVQIMYKLLICNSIDYNPIYPFICFLQRLLCEFIMQIRGNRTRYGLLRVVQFCAIRRLPNCSPTLPQLIQLATTHSGKSIIVGRNVICAFYLQC